MTYRILSVLSVAALGCASPGERPAMRSRTSPAVASDVRAPIVASIEGPDHPSCDRIELVLHLDRAGARVPAAIRLDLPPEVQLLEPETAEFVVDDARVETDLVIVITCNELPSAEVHAIVNAGASDFGFHADLVYRFGRPEELAPTPALAQESLVIGGRDFGPPVAPGGR